MVFQASGTRQYFLGIAGQQSGPFSDAEVLEKIHSREVPSDALVWYEGLPEWQAISSIEFFKEAFASAPQVPPDAINVPVNTTPAPESKPKESPAPPVKRARPSGTATAQPVASFAKEDSVPALFADGEVAPDEGETDQLKMIGVAFVALIVLGGGGLFLFSRALSSREEVPEIKLHKIPKVLITDRDVALREASSDLLTEPTASIETLRKLVIDKADDKVGKEALSTLLQYFRQNQRPMDAGRLMMDLKRPLEAYQFFRQDDSKPAQVLSELALYEAFQQATDQAQKRELLTKDIRILIQPLDRMDTAMERIRLFAKLFPGSSNPYGYYLKTTDEKIADIFNKISGYFIQTLLAYTASEFPEMHLDGTPLVEIRRERDQYRIVARYKGKVRLQRDLLENIHFTFWMIDGGWVMVDTNLTQERQSWARRNKVRYASKLMSADQMLNYEQGVFKRQFPDAGFHDVGSALKSHQPRREE